MNLRRADSTKDTPAEGLSAAIEMSAESLNRHKPGEFMKRVTRILLGISIAVLSFMASAHAQQDGQRIIANIPFDFTVGPMAYAAGHYEFTKTGDNVVVVRDGAGRSHFTLGSAWIQSSEVPSKPTLIFATVGGRHVLTQMWNDRADVGIQFPSREVSVEGEKQ